MTRTTVLSSLFRLCAFIFLRIIPTRVLKYPLPVLYFAYLLSWGFGSTAQPQPDAANGKAPDTKSDNAEEKPEQPKSVRSSADSGIERVLTLIFTLPTSSRPLQLASFLINTALLVFCADFLLKPYITDHSGAIFSRVGAVEAGSVKILIRYPNVENGTLKVVWDQVVEGLDATEPNWKDGPTIHLTDEQDWIGVAKLTRLWPSTTYQYRLAFPNSTLLPYPPEPFTFRTFPDPRLTTGSYFRFVASSCIIPNFPYFPFADNKIKGFDLLADSLWPQLSTTPQSSANTADGALSGHAVPAEVPSNESVLTDSGTNSSASLSSSSVLSSGVASRTEFLLFLGDFIYADVPSYAGDNLESYRRLYRRNYASSSFRRIYEHLPVFHMYDDHEIINNFAGSSNDSTPPYPNASSAYKSYQSLANYDSIEKDGFYYDFRYGDVAFFVLDTRRYRSSLANVNDEPTTMLGDAQLAALHQWLARVNGKSTFKFIVSSVPFTTLWGHDAQSDSWAGYAAERENLLTVLSSVPNVIILSGDRHEFAAIETGRVLEISTSPLSMFYIPFFRTLRQESTKQVEKKTTKIIIDEDGTPKQVELVELVPEEKVIKYIPIGNYKWSSFEVDTRDLDKPKVKLEVMVDGRKAWQLDIVGQPVPLHSSKALGKQLSQGLRGMLDKVGFNPSRWF